MMNEFFKVRASFRLRDGVPRELWIIGLMRMSSTKCLLDCHVFIRKTPDPDNDVNDFREMYVTPPDTDAYAVPKVLAPVPQKYIRCAQSDYGCYNVTEPPIDAPRDSMYKSEREVLKVFLTKHYRNHRLGDPDFTLDFEEIYVIDSKTKSITRAKVMVTIPVGKNRVRKNDLLVIQDNGNSFKRWPNHCDREGGVEQNETRLGEAS